MRRRRAVLLCACLAAVMAVVPTAMPQEAGSGQTYYWPNRTFNIPVNVDKINQADPKPTDLQLYSSLNRGPWQRGAKLPVTNLQNLGDGKKGFQFNADRDGEYEFSVQFWYADGSVSPKKADELSPVLTVVIDTTPPTIKLTAGTSGVQWVATDDNLDAKNITLQCKLPHWTEWRTITDRPFKPIDNYAWKMQAGQSLDVRVRARDQAGNEGFSAVVRVPNDIGQGAAYTKPSGGGAPDWLGNGTPSTRDPLMVPKSAGNIPDPRVSYVSTKDITIDYTIHRIGRSGIKAAKLYILQEKDPNGWKAGDEFPVDVQPNNKDQTLSLKYTAKDDGVYGFFVVPESFAGVKAAAPRKEDLPMMYVVVDTRDPYVRITGVRVSQGVRGPVLDIAWETNDLNLMPNPISLEYSVDQKAVQWKEIKYRVPAGKLQTNSTGDNRYIGQETWEVPDESVWKFYVRIRSTDMAGNTGVHIWGQTESNQDGKLVIVDTETPQAGITAVHGAEGSGGTRKPPFPSSLPTTPSPSPAPMNTPKPSEPVSPAPSTTTPTSPMRPQIPNSTPTGGPATPELPGLP